MGLNVNGEQRKFQRIAHQMHRNLHNIKGSVNQIKTLGSKGDVAAALWGQIAKATSEPN